MNLKCDKFDQNLTCFRLSYELLKAKRSHIKFYEVARLAAAETQTEAAGGQEHSHSGKVEAKCSLSKARCVGQSGE